MPASAARKRRWRPLLILGGSATLALVATVALGVLVTTTTRALGDNVRLTQDLVDGNVRTLSQVQRELLRLDRELNAPKPDMAEIDLYRSFAGQRIQEATLDYQGRTLGNPKLIARAEELSQRWAQDLAPRISEAIQTPRSLDEATRAELIADLETLELDYNQLVSDAENSRKVQAAAANAVTDSLAANTRLLTAGLLLTLLSLVTLVASTVRVLLTARREQLVAAERLKSAQALLRRHSIAVQTTDNPVLITDAQGRIEWANEAFTRLTGWAQDEVVGLVPGDFLQGPETNPATVEFMSAMVHARKAFSCEVVNYNRAGEPYWVSLDVHPIVESEPEPGAAPGDQSEVTGFVAVQGDITSQRLAEQSLMQAKEAAEETGEAKARFLASMSHEIRTPLNAVLGLTELLLDTDLDEDQRSYVTTAHESGRHLLAIVGDILDFSALETDQVEIESVPTNLKRMIDDVCAMLSPAADRAGLTLVPELVPGTPNEVLTDPLRVRQVLINLLSNGVKFTEEGEVRVRVGVEPATTNVSPTGTDPMATLTIAVSDTGVGIPADRQARIFEPFLQGDVSTTRTYGGTGLGLAICSRIATWLNGALEVESTPGEGSTFTLKVPVRLLPAEGPDATLHPESLIAGTTQAEQPHSEPHQLRVLLVEDDPVNRMVALHMLRRLGIEPDVAADGAEAVTQASASDYELILMDVHMPVMDGISATQEIRKLQGPRPRIVALTANVLEGDRSRMMDAGMDAYLSKPYRLEDIAGALAAVR